MDDPVAVTLISGAIGMLGLGVAPATRCRAQRGVGAELVGLQLLKKFTVPHEAYKLPLSQANRDIRPLSKSVKK